MSTKGGWFELVILLTHWEATN